MNHWIRESNRKKKEVQVGDLLYWRREYFSQDEWISLIIQFGSGPMLLENIYEDTKQGDTRYEVTDDHGRLILGVDPQRVEKVKIGFKADP